MIGITNTLSDRRHSFCFGSAAERDLECFLSTRAASYFKKLDDICKHHQRRLGSGASSAASSSGGYCVPATGFSTSRSTLIGGGSSLPTESQGCRPRGATGQFGHDLCISRLAAESIAEVVPVQLDVALFVFEHVFGRAISHSMLLVEQVALHAARSAVGKVPSAVCSPIRCGFLATALKCLPFG